MRRLIAAWIICVSMGVFLNTTPVEASNVAGKIQQAFTQGKASPLKQCLPEKGRVTVSIKAVGIHSGDYSRGQALALLRKAFSKYQTISFKLNSRSGAMRGDWVVRSKKKGTQKKITVYFSVKKKNGHAVITSIRGG